MELSYFALKYSSCAKSAKDKCSRPKLNVCKLGGLSFLGPLELISKYKQHDKDKIRL